MKKTHLPGAPGKNTMIMNWKTVINTLITAVAGCSLACVFVACGHNEKCVAITKERAKHLKNDTIDADVRVKVFIENSGSMDGYVNDMTSFKTDIYSLISSTSISSKKLYYINDTIIEQPDNARQFILNLSPISFKEKGGNRGHSDIANVIETVLASTNDREVALLASDYIFSLGHSSQDVNRFLDMQKIDVTNLFEEKFKKNKGFCVVFLRSRSQFVGTYYDPQDTPYVINQKRPFYVMLAGNRNAIAKLLNATRSVTSFDDEYAEFFPMCVTYEAMSKPVKGKYQIKKHGACGDFPFHLTKCKPENKTSEFEFQIAINFSKIPLSFKYLENIANYEISDSHFEITSIKSKHTAIGAHNYTHVMNIKRKNNSKGFQNANLKIKLKNCPPKWTREGNTNEIAGAPDENSTFGLSSLIGGISGAVKSQNKTDFFTEFDVIIEK